MSKNPQLQFVRRPSGFTLSWFPTRSLFVDSAADVRKVILEHGPNGEEPAIKVPVGAKFNGFARKMKLWSQAAEGCTLEPTWLA